LAAFGGINQMFDLVGKLLMALMWGITMLTDFGKIVKKRMVDEGISQGQLAQKLGISPGILSNYMTGKNIPEMETIENWIKYFALRNEEIRDIFTKAFSSTARANHSIHLDTRFFKRERLDLLAKAIVVIVPRFPYSQRSS
jgi:transcriptional regulator with XRE-family HTH domain